MITRIKTMPMTQVGHTGQDPNYVHGRPVTRRQRARRRKQAERIPLAGRFDVDVDINLLTGDLDQDIAILDLVV